MQCKCDCFCRVALHISTDMSRGFMHYKETFYIQCYVMLCFISFLSAYILTDKGLCGTGTRRLLLLRSFAVGSPPLMHRTAGGSCSVGSVVVLCTGPRRTRPRHTSPHQAVVSAALSTTGGCLLTAVGIRVSVVYMCTRPEDCRGLHRQHSCLR